MSQQKNVFVLIPVSCDAGTTKASVHVILFSCFGCERKALLIRGTGISNQRFEIILVETSTECTLPTQIALVALFILALFLSKKLSLELCNQAGPKGGRVEMAELQKEREFFKNKLAAL